MRFFAKKFVYGEKMSFHDSRILRDFHLFPLHIGIYSYSVWWPNVADTTSGVVQPTWRTRSSLYRSEEQNLEGFRAGQVRKTKTKNIGSSESGKRKRPASNFSVFQWIIYITPTHTFFDMYCRTSVVLIIFQNINKYGSCWDLKKIYIFQNVMHQSSKSFQMLFKRCPYK